MNIGFLIEKEKKKYLLYASGDRVDIESLFAWAWENLLPEIEYAVSLISHAENLGLLLLKSQAVSVCWCIGLIQEYIQWTDLCCDHDQGCSRSYT